MCREQHKDAKESEDKDGKKKQKEMKKVQSHKVIHTYI